MNRKSISILLTFIVVFLLLAGCSGGQQNEASTETTQEAAKEEEKEAAVILPVDAKIGIADASEEKDFTSFFIAKLSSYLVSAGIPEGSIERKTGDEEDLAANVDELIKSGCSVILVGDADELTAPDITDAAAEAGIPLLYFGTSPGEDEISRWEKEGLRACYIGSTYGTAAEKRASLLDSTDLEQVDFNENEEIGIVIMNSAEEEAGNTVNSDCMSILNEGDRDYNVLSESVVEAEAVDYESGEEDEEGDEESEPRDALRESAKNQVIEWMDEYGKDLEVIFCANDSMALGAADAVSEEKRKVGHDVLIFGFDCNAESLDKVASGSIRETFFNDFLEQAGTASDTVLAYLKGNSAQAVTTIEYVNVTVDNAQEILDISMVAQESTQTEEDAGEGTEEEETEE